MSRRMKPTRELDDIRIYRRCSILDRRAAPKLAKFLKRWKFGELGLSQDPCEYIYGLAEEVASREGKLLNPTRLKEALDEDGHVMGIDGNKIATIDLPTAADLLKILGFTTGRLR